MMNRMFGLPDERTSPRGVAVAAAEGEPGIDETPAPIRVAAPVSFTKSRRLNSEVTLAGYGRETRFHLLTMITVRHESIGKLTVSLAPPSGSSTSVHDPPPIPN